VGYVFKAERQQQHSEADGGAVERQNMTSVVVSLGSKHSGYSPEHEVARTGGLLQGKRDKYT
jgi:hypothetical protein